MEPIELVELDDASLISVLDKLLPDGTSTLSLAEQRPRPSAAHPVSLARAEHALTQASVVQSRLRNQLRETRDEIAWLRRELDVEQASNRVQIIQELIVVRLSSLSSLLTLR